MNSKNEAHIPPTRHIPSTWIVESWGNVPQELVRKLWNACGYIPEYEINTSNEGAIIPYSETKIGNMVDKVCGEDSHTNFEDEGDVRPDPFSPRDDEGNDENEEIFSEFDLDLCT